MLEVVIYGIPQSSVPTQFHRTFLFLFVPVLNNEAEFKIPLYQGPVMEKLHYFKQWLLFFLKTNCKQTDWLVFIGDI